jgi:hypothetical protein
LASMVLNGLSVHWSISENHLWTIVHNVLYGVNYLVTDWSLE